jgi:hypothetical protein
VSKRERDHLSLLPKPPLLITESAEEFEAIHEHLERVIQPGDIIEDIYVSDIAYLACQIVRFRRCKSAIINAGYKTAMLKIFPEFLRDPGESCDQVRGQAEDLAWKWFRDPKMKASAAWILKEHQLDQSVIEATAIQNSLPDLERLDKMEASCELRLRKALNAIADWREGLAQRLRDAADGIINGNAVLKLEDSSRKPAAD